MTKEEIDEIIQQTKAEFLNENVVKESDLETLQKQSYAKGWNACNHRWIQTLNEYLSKLQVEPCGDTISRTAAIKVASGYCHPANITEQLAKLPPVTPKPKTGHWKLVQRGKSIDVCCSNCKAVRIKGYAYGYTIDQLDKEYVKESFESDDMRYCPYCGSDNRGRTIVKES